MKETMNDKEKAAMAAGVQFGMELLKQIPREDPLKMEAHMTGVLVVFWGALWGTFGTEYARGFIERQLHGMKPGQENERFTAPRVQ